MKRLLSWVVCGAFVAGVFGVAFAQFAKSEDAIEYRQAVMILMGNHFSRIGAVVQGKKPFDQKDVQQNAALVATLAKLPWEAFMYPGSDKGKTHMKSKALKEKEDFKKDADALETATAKLAQAADTGNLDAVKSQFGGVGKSCKECHDEFRSH